MCMGIGKTGQGPKVGCIDLSCDSIIRFDELGAVNGDLVWVALRRSNGDERGHVNERTARP